MCYIPNYIKNYYQVFSYKNLNGMIIMLVPTDKRKVACVLNRSEMLSTKATTKKGLLLHYPESS